MKNLYLFSYITETIILDLGKKKEKYLIFFCPYKNILENSADINNELRSYFQRNILPDKIIAICASFNENEIVELFTDNSELYDYIPLFKLDKFHKNISVVSLQNTGSFKIMLGFNITSEYLKEVFSRGMVKIFNDNGGLIVSQSAHHFVFPSGKHSDRFLRPGNVLLKGIKIQFIAFAIYHHFQGRKFSNIYCDTSSINSLAYAINDLSKEFDINFKTSIRIESFGSYEGFESAKFSAPKDCLFLISASTSGSIIKRMLDDKKKIIQEENICIVYGLDVEKKYEGRIVCDLTKNASTNPEGLDSFESYNVNKGQRCQFCTDNSKPVEVKGDVFLLEKPAINGILLSKNDLPLSLKTFSEYFNKRQPKESLIKCFFKENSTDEKKYEIYIDIEELLGQWQYRNEKHPYEKIFIKLEKYILQNIPASLKYMIVLPDTSSLMLAKIISSVLKSQGLYIAERNILKMKEISKLNKDTPGTVAIISSSIATGRNLLFISRALRDYDSVFQRIYFTLINRTSDLKHYEFLESNLSLGEFGKRTHKIINVENILCPHEAIDTNWHEERNFLKKLGEYCEDKQIYPKAEEFCTNRIDELNNSGTTNGLIDNLFFPAITNSKLKIKKGFVYAPNQNKFISESTQADIYFIICTILNEIRNNGRLNQTEYVRNLLEPGNFVRFNDGIIQAAILRAAKNDELRYDLSESMSLQIQAILEDMINHIEDEHAEALIEFFYSIAIKKLRITSPCLISCINSLKPKQLYKENQIIESIIHYIEHTILNEIKSTKPPILMIAEE